MKNKGAAAIIATVLLLMMAVAAAGVSYTWVMNMQKSIQKDVEKKYGNDAAKTNSQLSIESVWKNGANNIEFTLRNTGSYGFNDITPFTFYIDGVRRASPGWSGMLSPGNLTTVTTTESFPTYPAAPSKTIKVASDTGVSVTYKCEITSATQSYC